MRILSLVLAMCLVFGAVSLGAADNEELYGPMYASTYNETYDLPVYGTTYPGTPDTDWIPGYEVGISEEAVLAGQVLAAPGLLIVK